MAITNHDRVGKALELLNSAGQKRLEPRMFFSCSDALNRFLTAFHLSGISRYFTGPARLMLAKYGITREGPPNVPGD